MNGVTLTLRTLYHGESALARELVAAADRHRAEHEVHHVATDLAGWSREHVGLLARTGLDYGLDLATDAQPSAPGLPFADPQRATGDRTVRDVAAEVIGPHPESGPLLLLDLRALYLTASGNFLSWEMLAQVAQARKDGRLLGLATACHPRTLRQLRWVNTQLKTLSPQILSSL
ncbi:hypothetical protein [Streptomyces zagrosensis]|uniref:Uncharacterized protein n=1 Tax=Streptomyces zagrosensis TaxID=1042984 RepID=A0A7W9QIP0_9ACTN|nr:hypothetical protein [Streptomyces zagrosensis]MBB5939682.1 hypothetical protein [Streptomyces zagrosensis]